MTRPYHSSPLYEGGYASPAMASRLTGFSPFELRNLISHFDPIRDDEPVVRSIHVRGRRLIHLDDLLLIAHALAERRRIP